MESVSATCTQCTQKFYVKDPLYPRGPRVPLILSCSHVVCEKCLTSSLRQAGSITCKKCDHVSTGAGLNVAQIKDVMKEYPVHLNMLGLYAKQYELQPPLEDSSIRFIPAGATWQPTAGGKSGGSYTLKMASNVVGLQKIMCDECPQNQAVWKCKQCAMTYCDSCFQKVHKFKSNRNHEKTALAKDPASKPAVAEQIGRCTEHPLQKLEFFCRDCDECVCSHCIVPSDSAHRAHNVGAVSDMNEEYFPVLQASVEVANGVHQRLRNAELALSAKTGLRGSVGDEEPDEKLVAIAQQYVDHFAWVHAALQRTEARVLAQLSVAVSEGNKKKQAVREAVTQHIAHVKGLIESAEGILDNAVTADLPHLVTLAQQLRSLQQLPCDLAVQKQLQPFRCVADEALVEALLNHYKLEFPPVQDVKLVRVEDIDADWSIVAIPDCTSVDSSHPEPSVPASSRASSVCDLDSEDRSSVTNEHPAPTRGFIPPQTQEVVKVSHIKDPSDFYVLRIPDAKFLQDLSTRIQRIVLKQRPISATDALEGHLFLAKYSLDEKWYRGRVRTAPRTVGSLELVEVVYVDYGNFDVVPLAELRSLPLEFKTIPPLALRCTLARASPIAGAKWDEQAVAWFAKICKNTHFNCSVYAFKGDYYEVDIGQIPGDVSKGVPLSVADALIFLEYGQIADESAMGNIQIQRSGFTVPKRSTSFSENHTFLEGDVLNVMVSHVENPHSFYVQRMDHTSKYIIAYTNQLTTMYATPVSVHRERDWGPIYAPTVGMACAALFPVDGKWYRAKVVALPGHKKVEIQYVDYGNKATVMYTDIRVLKEEFFRTPALAKLCSLADVAPTKGDWSAEATAALVAASLDKVLKVHILAAGSDTAPSCVVLKEMRPTEEICINHLLVYDSHAVSTGPASSAATTMQYPVLTEEAEEMMSGVPDTDDPSTKNASPPKKSPAQKKNSPQKKVFSRKKGAIPKFACEDVGSSSGEAVIVDTVPPATVASPVKGVPQAKGKEALRIQVKIVRSLSPDAIFVTLLPNVPLIKAMMDEMALFYEGSEPWVRETWQRTHVCAAYREQDKKWYRGIFLDYYEKDYATVTLRDIATKEYIPLRHLRRLDEKFMKVRDGAFLCHLAGILPAGGSKWSQMACELVSQFFTKHSKFYITKKGEVTNQSLPIEVLGTKLVCEGPLDPISEQIFSLNKDLVDQGGAIPIRGANEVPFYTVQEVMQELEDRPDSEGSFSNVPLQVVPPAVDDEYGSVSDSLTDDEVCEGDWLPVSNMDLDTFEANPTYVDHVGFIYLHDQVEARQGIEIIQRKLQQQFQNCQPNLDWEWEPKQMCVAKYHLDGNWYRARTIQLEQNGDWKVVFVDYGNEETCSVREMQPSSFLRQIPVQCHKCYLNNIAPVARDGRWTLEALDFLHTLVVDQRCTVSLVMPPDTPDPIPIQLLRFDGVNVSAQMVNNSYARFVGQGSRVLAPPDPSVAAIELDPKRAAKSPLPPGRSLSPHPSTKRLSFDPQRDLCNITPGPIHYGAGDSASGTTRWADELDDAEDVETCSGDSSEEDRAADESSKESLKKYLLSGFDGVKITTSVAKVTGPECPQIKTLSVRSGFVSASQIADELSASGGAHSDVSSNLTSCPDSEEEESLATEEDEAGAPTARASGKSSPDLFLDAVQIKETTVPIAKSDDMKKTLQGEKLSSYAAKPLPPVDMFTVMVKAVVSPTEVRVHVMCGDTTSQLSQLGKLEKEMQTEAPKQPQIYQPVAGMACVALLGERWIRGAVMDTQGGSEDPILVQAVDHGSVDSLSPVCVLQSKKEWTELAPMLQTLQLWQVGPAADYSLADVKEYLAQAVVDKPLIARVKEREPVMLVELLNLDESSLAYQQLIDAAILVVTGC